MTGLRSAGSLVAAALCLWSAGCNRLPGQPQLAQKWQAPTDVVDFKKLYAENCRGCHGIGSEASGSIALDDQMYLSVIPHDKLREIVVQGVSDTRMPPFSEEHGGLLLDKQIEALVAGIAGSAANPPLPGPFPPYSAPPGNPVAGAAAFGTYCASCHGADGNGGKAGSVVNPVYLGLVSDQYLRTIVIAGRRDLGCPNYRERVPQKAMTDAEISDVVGWLASQRKNEFGKPLTAVPR